jgi:hypothetical protein
MRRLAGAAASCPYRRRACSGTEGTATGCRWEQADDSGAPRHPCARPPLRGPPGSPGEHSPACRTPGGRLLAGRLHIRDHQPGHVPTRPLYAIYQRQWHFSLEIVTLIFAAYAWPSWPLCYWPDGALDQIGRKPVMADEWLTGRRVMRWRLMNLIAAMSAVRAAARSHTVRPPRCGKLGKVLAGVSNPHVCVRGEGERQSSGLPVSRGT